MGRDSIRWHRSGEGEWTSNVERTYYAVIGYTPPGDHLVTVYDDGDLEVENATYATIGLAKNHFRKFLLDK